MIPQVPGGFLPTTSWNLQGFISGYHYSLTVTTATCCSIYDPALPITVRHTCRSLFYATIPLDTVRGYRYHRHRIRAWVPPAWNTNTYRYFTT